MPSRKSQSKAKLQKSANRIHPGINGNQLAEVDGEFLNEPFLDDPFLDEPLLDEPLPTVSDGADKSDRDEKGRFTKGNKQGKGNPFARKMGAMRSAFLDAVNPDEVKELAALLFEKAKAGDLEAAKLFLVYAVGKPTSAVDPDRLDLDEFHLYDSWPSITQAMRAVLDSASPTALAELIPQMTKEDSAEELTRLIMQTENKLSVLERLAEEKKARVGKRP